MPSGAHRAELAPEPRLVTYDWMPLTDWYARHALHVAVAERGDAKILFFGDSITQKLEKSPFWEFLAGLGAVNFGMGGDLIQNVHWRCLHGLVGKLSPHSVVLMAGVNNLRRDDAGVSEVVSRMELLIETLRQIWPEARVILYGILPTEFSAEHPFRDRIDAINHEFGVRAKRWGIVFRDLKSHFVTEDGSLRRDRMIDEVHPGLEGLASWNEDLLSFLHPLFQETGEEASQGSSPKN